MPSNAICRNPGRLELLRAQNAFNAIDYLLVVDGEGVPDGLRQRVLLVRFLLVAGVDGLDATHIEIRGGVRVKDPAVRWATRLGDLNPATIDPALTAPEQAYLAAIQAQTTEPDAWLATMVEQRGDHSTYTLALRDGGQPPAGFDLVLSQVDFSFKVECPTPFDCDAAPSCPTEVADEPELDYLARDFKSFRRLMFDRLALISPNDVSTDPAQLRTALVETLAYAADRLAYFQDAVATEAYLGTARTRPSVRRHARLLDYPMHEGCNSRTFVHLRLAEGIAVAGSPLAPGAAFFSRLASGGAVLGLNAVGQALAEGPAVFEALLAPETFSAAHNELAFHTWGDSDCCLPKGATEADVVDAGGFGLAPGDFLLIEQIRSETGSEADADPAMRCVVRLTEVGDPVPDALFPGTVVRTLRWHGDDALSFAFPLSLEDQPLAVARGNLVLADHGRTIADEELDIAPWGNQGGLRATLARTGLSWREPLPADGDAAEPPSARALAEQDPRHARPSLDLRGEDEDWAPVRDLLSSTASAREFVVEMESDGRAHLRFGDDVLGRRPARYEGAADDLYRATYRIGNGHAGDLGAEAIAHVVADPALTGPALTAAVVGVRNPVPAVGGRDGESLDEVKRYAPQAFRIQQRAVTVADWVEVTERHGAVQRAVAQLRWTGSWHTVYVTVDPVAGREFDDIRDELVDHLQPFRLAGYDLEVVAPTYVPLDIACTVCVAPNHFQEDVERALLAEFGTGRLADGRRGFFHPDEFTFGQSVWLSQVVARCMGVRGVKWVDLTSSANAHRFKRWGEPQGAEIADARIRIGALEIARCDNDRNAPDNGQIRFYMEGGA